MHVALDALLETPYIYRFTLANATGLCCAICTHNQRQRRAPNSLAGGVLPQWGIGHTNDNPQYFPAFLMSK